MGSVGGFASGDGSRRQSRTGSGDGENQAGGELGGAVGGIGGRRGDRAVGVGRRSGWPESTGEVLQSASRRRGCKEDGLGSARLGHVGFGCWSRSRPEAAVSTSCAGDGLGLASRRVQALILSPTRELAAQTEKVILAIGDYINVQAHACIGGKSIGEDIRKLEYGVHAVSGTPGRVCDMIKRRTLRTRSIKLLILDESDEMLSRGFKDQIYDVYRYLPPDLQANSKPFVDYALHPFYQFFIMYSSFMLLY
ncbi:hypothetical protein M5K25_003899 [Dendrobium thyrsiflorum]|uniref:Helicase ATP-binding domain-containing protein n=1 Tax=Dendrobium thyrsiflorum TaxID=117978 RepID=A0ABD0VSQ5_DENTH